uniref:RST domain-containing protein n=1 Tax=Aegilops tauschii subsp. strangulata TaxID=200361 RepID=A0A453SM77_AEGTS
MQIMGETGEAPTSPWISFRVLFAMIQDNISSVAKELLFHHYEELKENEISREEMVKKMIIIVGEKLLLETLKKLHYCPSLWHKSSVEVMSSDPARVAAEDPARTTEEYISLDKTTGHCALTLGNLGDSCGPNTLAESSTALSTKGCDTLAVATVPKSHDSVAPSSVPETSTSSGGICLASPSVKPKSRDSPIRIMSPESSANHGAKNQDPSAARMAPTLHDVLRRTASGKSASRGAEGSNGVAPSMRPHGYASPAPTNASKGRGIGAPGLSLKGSECPGPVLALGSTKFRGMKSPSSVPRMTPEGPEFLSLSIAPQSQVIYPTKCHGGDLSSSVAAPAHVPGHVNSSALSAEGCDSLALSIAPNCHDPPASSNNEPAFHGAPTTNTASEGEHSQAPSAATMDYTAPAPTTGEAVQFGPCNKPSAPVPEPGSNVAQAADILVALSTPREKGK